MTKNLKLNLQEFKNKNRNYVIDLIRNSPRKPIDQLYWPHMNLDDLGMDRLQISNSAKKYQLYDLYKQLTSSSCKSDFTHKNN